MRFTDKVALITAAGAGIGRATAEIMSREGAAVIVVDLDKSRVDDTVASLGKRALGIACDALDPGAVAAAVALAVRTFGRVDILVNGVGGSTIVADPLATVEELSHTDWQRLVAFNLDATFLFCHEVVPIMKAMSHGKIVNVSSIAGRGVSTASSVGYAAGKGGIIAMTKKLSLETARYGINVNAIAPSFTVTERMQESWDERGELARNAIVAQVPIGRIATAQDQAKVICFLASSDADFITGLTIDVTGGQT